MVDPADHPVLRQNPVQVEALGKAIFYLTGEEGSPLFPAGLQFVNQLLVEGAHLGVFLGQNPARGTPQGAVRQGREAKGRKTGGLFQQAAAEEIRRGPGQLSGVGVLGFHRNHFRCVLAPRLFPKPAGSLKGSEGPLPREEIVLDGEQQDGLGGHSRQHVYVVQPVGDAPRPNHFVVGVNTAFHHGLGVGDIGAGRGAGEAVPCRQHQHTGLGAAAGVAGQGDALRVHLLPCGQVIQCGDAVPDKVPGQAKAQELALPVQQVVFAGAALNGLEVHLRLVVLEALPLP